MVPKGWSLKLISDVAKVVTGSTPSTKNQEYYGGDIPFVSPADLGRGKLVEIAAKTLTEQGFIKTRVIRPGSTLFTCIGSTIGKLGMAGRELATNQQINSVIPHSGYDDDFIFYQLELRAGYIAKLAGTQAVPIINKSTFESQSLLVPSALPEQKKIAQILSTWDKAITTTEQLLANSQQQKKALMQQLLTGPHPSKPRLLDKNGVRFSGEWQVCQLSDVVSSLDSGVSVNGIEQDVEASHFVLKTSCISDGVFVPEEVKRVIEEKEITRLKEPLLDDSILISRMNTPALVGANSYVECAPSNTYPPDRIWQVKANESKVLMRWLAFWFSSEKTRTALSDLASGTSGSMKNISKKSVLAMSIQCPSLEEQKKIAAVISTADQEISALKQKLDALKEEKKALMQQLLTGKRRVKVN